MSLLGADLVRGASRWSAPNAGTAPRMATPMAAPPSATDSFRSRMWTPWDFASWRPGAPAAVPPVLTSTEQEAINQQADFVPASLTWLEDGRRVSRRTPDPAISSAISAL